MSKREGEMLSEEFSFNRSFNFSVPKLIIVKQRQMCSRIGFKILHSETFFVSKDNQVMLISFHYEYKRVDTLRIYWSDDQQDVGYEELIEEYEKKNKFKYIYSKEYDISKYPIQYEFSEIQKIARDIASIPYTRSFSNCNHSTSKLLSSLYSQEKLEWKFTYYVQIGCTSF